MAAERVEVGVEAERKMAKRVEWRRWRLRRRLKKEGERRRRYQRRQTREIKGKEEEGTLERHSKRRSLGREEIVVAAVG